MNSNNLELSLIEHEIDKISSKYHLKNQVPQMTQNLAALNQNQNQNPLGVGVITQSQATLVGSNMILQPSTHPYLMSAPSDITLHKQAKPTPNQKLQNAPKINPKDLSNEELEYIIKHGKLPPKYSHQTDENQVLQKSTHVYTNMPQQQQQMNSMKSQPNIIYYDHQVPAQQTPSLQEMNKTSNSLPQLQSYMIGGTQFDKENISVMDNTMAGGKHLNSPRILSDYLMQKQHQSSATNPFATYNMSQMSQPLLLNPSSTSFNNLYLEPQANDTQGSLNPNTTQMTQPNLNASMVSQQSTSQAATQALKALQERVKQLEKEKALVEDKLAIHETQGTEQVKRLQQKLKEETEKGSNREQQLREEIQILKKQLESVESEKLRHLEQNSSEREQWRTQFKKLEEENLLLKRQLQEQLTRYETIEDTIKDIQRREQQLRDRQERELELERQRLKVIEEEREQERQRYEQLKMKLTEKGKMREQELNEIRQEMERQQDDREKEMRKLEREAQKWRKECMMLKEEINILNSDSVKVNETKDKRKRSKLQKSAIPAETPKNNISGKRCQSPGIIDVARSRMTNQILNASQPINNHFQSIESEKHKVKKAKQSSGMKGSQLSTHRKQHSNQNIAVADMNQSLQKQTHIEITLGASGSIDNRKSERNRSTTSNKKNISSSGRSAKKSQSRLKKSKRSVQGQQERSKSRQTDYSQEKERVTRHRFSQKSLTSGVPSQQNLISINTKSGVAENIKLDQLNQQDSTIFSGRPGLDSQEFILVDSYDGEGANCFCKRGLSSQRLLNDQIQILNQQNNSENKQQFNQYKRPSIESLGGPSSVIGGMMSSVNPLSNASEYGAMLYSQQNTSVDQNQVALETLKIPGIQKEMSHFNNNSNLTLSNTNSNRPLDINDFASEACIHPTNKQQVDNEIFYLEREIFDYNQQYKSLLTQQTNSVQSNVMENNSQMINSKLRQIAQMLEEKSERLFDLKKQQQQILLKESYQTKNPFINGIIGQGAVGINTHMNIQHY